MDGEKFVNRTGWVAGIWDSELDKYEWLDESTKLRCLILRNKIGTLCGYVSISPDNKLYKQHKTVIDRCVNVYGGVTYAGRCKSIAEPLTTSHIHPIGLNSVAQYLTGENLLWWVGFDTNHYQDLSPYVYSVHRSGMSPDRVYKDLKFIANEVKHLAAQLSLFANKKEVNQENQTQSQRKPQSQVPKENRDVVFEYMGFEGFARRDELTSRWYGIVRGTGTNPLVFDGNSEENAFEDMKLAIDKYLQNHLVK